MKGVNFLLIFFLLIGFLGCVVAFQSINEETLSGISVGMNKEEVINIAGEPAQKKNRLIDGKEYKVWSYPIKELFAGKYNPLGYSYYEVLFLDGKVKQWYKTKVYSQPKYELQQPQAPEGARTFKIFER
ncbi:MAG: hypothetical protein ISS45_04810 [Candidatus Omnitrophica bacterium]|nr:hypothetical protein [Candidatus Omnitrophota bacterium]